MSVLEMGACLFDSVYNGTRNLFKCQSNLKALEKEMDALAHLQNVVLDQVHALHMECNSPTPQVEEWLRKVDNILHGRHPKQPGTTADNKRLSGCYYSCYHCGKTSEILREIEMLNKTCPMPVSYKETKLEPRCEDSVYDQTQTLAKVMDLVSRDEIRRIGIWGVAGIGKTTLLKQLYNVLRSLESEQPSGMVIWVTVSKEWDMLRIQKQVAESLNLVVVGSVERMAIRLHERLLKEKRIILILDDVWENIDFDSLGIPQPEVHMGCKILFASRSQIVCQMMKADKIVKVDVMNYEESWQLFTRYAGGVANLEQIKPLAAQVVTECSGLPLAIVILGTYMRGKESIHLWVDTLVTLRESMSLPYFKGIEEKALKWSHVSLQGSFNIRSGFNPSKEDAFGGSSGTKSFEKEEKFGSSQPIMRNNDAEFINLPDENLRAKATQERLSTRTSIITSVADASNLVYGRKAASQSKQPEIIEMEEQSQSQSSWDRTDQFQIVRCPKCSKFLPEFSNFTIYQCGQCGIFLQPQGSFKSLSDFKPPKEDGFGGSSSTKSFEKEEKFETSQPIPRTNDAISVRDQYLRAKATQEHLSSRTTIITSVADASNLVCEAESQRQEPEIIEMQEQSLSRSSWDEADEAKSINLWGSETAHGSVGTDTTTSISATDTSERKTAFQRQHPEVIQMQEQSLSHSSPDKVIEMDEQSLSHLSFTKARRRYDETVHGSVGTHTKTTTSLPATDTSERKTAVQRQHPEIIQMHEQSLSHSSPDRAALPIDMSYEAMAEKEMVTILTGGNVKNDRTLKCIIEHITNPVVGKIGIYGKAGVGKTTVMGAMIHNQEIKEMFDHVIWVAVPVVWNVMQVQLEIAKQLSYSIEPVNVHDNMVRLSRLMKHLKFLLILDNVGEQIDLKMVGIPELAPESGSKIVLITRSKQVCHIMNVNLKIQLEDLLSWELFSEKVGDVVNHLSIQPIARQVVEMCSHYCLAIVLMAGTLRGVFDTSLWNDALERLSIQNGSGDGKFENLMISVLKFCWERLEDDMTRNCFRNCAMYSEEQEIDVAELLERWVSNGLIGTLEKGKSILKNLIDAYLLESGEGVLFITMRYVVRHVLVNLILPPEECRLFLMRGGLGLTEPPKDEEWENAKEIYLQENNLCVLPENPRCYVLSALFLQRNKKLRTIPPLFFADMPALQVLNLSRTGIKSLPESLFRLVNLKRLYLNSCDRFMVLSPKIGDLKQLEVLDMEGTEVMDLPVEVRNLTALKSLEVSFYGYRHNSRRPEPANSAIPCGLISSLDQLQELNITVHPDDEGWDSCVETIAAEVFSLPMLSTLKIYFPRVELLRQFILWNGWTMQHPSLSHFRITVGPHVTRIMDRIPRDVEFETERWDRCFRYVNGVNLPGDVKRLLRLSTFFYLDRHSTIEKLSDFGTENMEELQCCVVAECNKLQVIIDGEVREEETQSEIVCESDENNRTSLRSLEYLYIYYMKSLRSIWEGPVQRCFQVLKCLRLHTCPQLTTVFTPELLHNFYNLEELAVRDCPAVLRIVTLGVPARPETSYCLPKLRRISLHYMTKLVCISSGLCMAPELELVSFYDCPNLKSLSREEMCSKELRKVEGERIWWEALECKPNHLNAIFVPIHGCV